MDGYVFLTIIILGFLLYVGVGSLIDSYFDRKEEMLKELLNDLFEDDNED
jgi:hypothetical protein